MTTQARQAGRPCCLKNVSAAGMPRYLTLNHQWAIQKRARMKRSKETPMALPGGRSISCSIFPSCGYQASGRVFSQAQCFSAGALAMIGRLGRRDAPPPAGDQGLSAISLNSTPPLALFSGPTPRRCHRACIHDVVSHHNVREILGPASARPSGLRARGTRSLVSSAPLIGPPCRRGDATKAQPMETRKFGLS